MARRTRIDKDFVVIQTGHSQLSIANLNKIGENKLVVLSSPVETFVVNAKNNTLAVLQTDQRWSLFRLNTGEQFEPRGAEIKCMPFNAILLQVDTLWCIELREEGNVLIFGVQYFDDTMPTQHRLSLPTEYGALELTVHVHNDDRLVCAFGHANGTLLAEFVIDDSEGVKCLDPMRKVAETQVTKLAISADNRLMAYSTNRNMIHVIEDEHEARWRVKSKAETQSLSFDTNFERSLTVITDDNTVFLLYLMPKTHQLVLLESINASKTNSSIITLRLPNIYTLEQGGGLSKNKPKPLLDLQRHQQAATELFALDHSSFVERLHNVDFVDDRSAWLTISKRCLCERDIDSAIYCAAKSGDARLARALRHEMETRDLPSACAILAINLGLAVEGEELLRHDPNMLAKILQLQNKWTEVFTHVDKIQLKSSYYDYARHLEEEGKIVDAIKHYELSGNVLVVPRMLFETGNIDQLEEYCLKRHQTDRISSLVTWWGQYCESQGDHKTAIEVYESVSDHYNLVRLMCHVGQTDKAIKIVNRYLSNSNTENSEAQSHSKDITAAMLYLGKHLEALNSTESIQYYLHCGAVRHAIRMCINNELYDQLVTIAVEHCGPLEAKHILQTYFQNNQDSLVNQENLVKLNYKCGFVHQAILLAIKHNSWSQLRMICESELSHNDSHNFVVSDQVLEMALQALKHDTGLIDIVIDLIIMSNPDNFSLITQTVKDYGANIDDSLIDKLERYTTANGEANPALVDTFAELCLEKGNYQLAAKLYNKMGKRVDSLKALIRSGNVEKVVQFASVARDKTVFKMAANFLQTINHKNTELVIKFYTKAEAYEELDRYRRELEETTVEVTAVADI